MPMICTAYLLLASFLGGFRLSGLHALQLNIAPVRRYFSAPPRDNGVNHHRSKRKWLWEGHTAPIMFDTLTEVESWPARQLLRAREWADAVAGGYLFNVYASNSSVFPYFSEIGMQNSIFSKSFKPPFSLVTAKSSDVLISRSKNADERQSDAGRGGIFNYLYFSGDIRLPELDHIRTAIRPGQIVDVPVTANVWIGKGGVAAPAHYDDVHNVYVQLFGKKTFTILPHDSIKGLCVCGRLHPHARQSRYLNLSRMDGADLTDPTVSNVDFEELIDESDVNWRFELIRKIGSACNADVGVLSGIQVTLEPGNVLYLPPFWFHEVKTDTTGSVSLSLWWDSAALDVMDDLYALPLPFESHWNESVAVFAASLFGRMLIEDVIAKVHCHSLTRVTLFALLKARYIEDQILLDSVNKYSKLSDSSISELMKVTGLDITEGMQNFISKRDALSNVFVRLHHAVDASGEVNTHACGVVGTKLLDYIEDVLLFATNSREDYMKTINSFLISQV